jgi:hypothetical protein
MDIQIVPLGDGSIAVVGEGAKSIGKRINRLKGAKWNPRVGAWTFPESAEPKLRSLIAHYTEGEPEQESPAKRTTASPIAKPTPAAPSFDLHAPFVGADGKLYQYIVYTVPYLRVNDVVYVNIGDTSYQYRVVEAEGRGPPLLSVLIEPEEGGERSRLVVRDGQLQVEGFDQSHTVTTP